jgi:hypothetical protein
LGDTKKNFLSDFPQLMSCLTLLNHPDLLEKKSLPVSESRRKAQNFVRMFERHSGRLSNKEKIELVMML